MKRLLLTAFVLLATLTTPAFAQNQKEIARFYVSKATINGRDVTSQVIGNDAYTVFYEVENKLYMANVWEKQDSQSWGPVLRIVSNHYPETNDAYEADEFKFDWSFRNSYDSKRGVCRVIFSKIYKPSGVVSILKLIEESGDETKYIGYMKGSINFSKYY